MVLKEMNQDGLIENFVDVQENKGNPGVSSFFFSFEIN